MRSRRRLGPWVIAAVLALALLLTRLDGDDFPSFDGAKTARVERVVDGDTVLLTGIGRVRLIGVDTPEVYGQDECYGRQASAYAKRVLVPGRRVRYRLGVEERDRYGRALAYLGLEDGRFVNRLLVELGYATPLTIPPNDEFAGRFVADARHARDARRGLWRACTSS